MLKNNGLSTKLTLLTVLGFAAVSTAPLAA
jgi:hypothetical protein